MIPPQTACVRPFSLREKGGFWIGLLHTVVPLSKRLPFQALLYAVFGLGNESYATGRARENHRFSASTMRILVESSARKPSREERPLAYFSQASRINW